MKQGCQNFQALVFLEVLLKAALTSRGEFTVPASLRKAAHLEKDVVLVGVQDRVEIWDKALWEERSMVSEEDLDAIAERMEAIGIRI